MSMSMYVFESLGMYACEYVCILKGIFNYFVKGMMYIIDII